MQSCKHVSHFCSLFSENSVLIVGLQAMRERVSTLARAESYLWLIYKPQQVPNWHCCWPLWGHPGIWMGYLLEWGLGSFLSVQGHRKPISTLPGTLWFGRSWEQRCIYVSVVKIPIADSVEVLSVCVCAQSRGIQKTQWLCVQLVESKPDNARCTVDNKSRLKREWYVFTCKK